MTFLSVQEVTQYPVWFRPVKSIHVSQMLVLCDCSHILDTTSTLCKTWCCCTHRKFCLHLHGTQMSRALFRLGFILDRQCTSVLCISNSGQTFPTIQAARVLSAHLPGQVFVMSGSIDTKMSLAVDQKTWKVCGFFMD